MKISRSKVELFLECPQCFYLDIKHRVSRPPGYPFSLNNAVDLLLKKEFDRYRALRQPHPLQAAEQLDFIPAEDTRLERWRNAFAGGISYDHPTHDCTYYGAIDDLWINDNGAYAVVDYKATAGERPVSELPAWASSYQRQLSFYAWLLRRNGLQVIDTGYLIYATASTSRTGFDQRLDFDLRLIPITLDDHWIETTLDQMQNIIRSEALPPASQNCKHCQYRAKASGVPVG